MSNDLHIPEIARKWFFRMSLTALVVTIFVAGLYFLRFHGDFSNDTAHWGQFGDYLGGVLNALFGLLTVVAALLAYLVSSQGLQATRDASRVTTTVTLIERYLSAEMLTVRRIADAWLIKACDQDVVDLLAFEAHPSKRGSFKATPEYDAVWRLLEFFQEVSVLLSAGVLDDKTLSILITRYHTWRHEELLGKVFRIARLSGLPSADRELALFRAINERCDKDYGVPSGQNDQRMST